MNSKLIIIGAGLGIIMLIMGLTFAVGQSGGLLSGFQDGQKVTCNVNAEAKLSGLLVVNGVPACLSSEKCSVNPFKSIFNVPGTVEGELAMWQSGKTFTTTSIELNKVGASKNFQLTACIPEEARQVRIGTINSQGGVDDDVLADIK